MCLAESGFLESERLLLRRPERRDIPAIVPLANDYDVAKNLSTMPHPYTASDGEAFLARMDEKRDHGLRIRDHAQGGSRLHGQHRAALEGRGL